MELSAVIVFSLAVFSIRDVQAAPALAARVAAVEEDIGTWELTTVDIRANMTALARRVGLVFAEVDSLKANAQNIKTQLNTITQELKRVQRERDTYRKSLRKLRRRLTKDIRTLQLQLNPTVVDPRDARTTKYPGTTAASTDPSPSNTALPSPVTTQDSDLQATSDPSPSTTVPPSPVTTQDSDPHATPSQAANRDLYNASREGDLERVKRILSAGHVDINTRRRRYNRTPVMEAAFRGHSDVVEFLVGRGADVSLVVRGGNNVLHWACMGGDLEIVKLILSLNVVDINSRGEYSGTPVMMAAWRGHRDVVEFLVGRGADVSLVDRSGNNFLHYACMGADLEIVKLILSLNVVDINARNNYGWTAANWARDGEHQRVLDLLVSRGGH